LPRRTGENSTAVMGVRGDEERAREKARVPNGDMDGACGETRMLMGMEACDMLGRDSDTRVCLPSAVAERVEARRERAGERFWPEMCRLSLLDHDPAFTFFNAELVRACDDGRGGTFDNGGRLWPYAEGSREDVEVADERWTARHAMS
jgi:hypothetical protein